MQDEYNKLLFVWQKTNPILPKHVAECANSEFCFIFKGQCHLQLMHINVYVNIFYIYLYTYSTYTHTHTRTHTHGWCRPLQSHGAINSQIYKINRFSSNRSLLDVEVTHENKTDSNPDPADWMWAPPCYLGAVRGWPQLLQAPAGGWQSPLETFSFVFGCRNFLQTIPSLLLQALGECMAAVLLGTGNVPPLICQCQSHRSNPKGRRWRGHQIKAAFSNTGWSTKWGFFYQKGPVSLFFPCLWSSYYIF